MLFRARGPLRATKGLIFFWGVQKCWSGASGVERTWVWLGGFIGASRHALLGRSVLRGTVRSGGVGDEACADTVISGWSVGSCTAADGGAVWAGGGDGGAGG